jgi:uncharacterized protein
MSTETLDQSVAFVAHMADERNARSVDVTFHGGEPLLAGLPFLARSFERFRTVGSPVRFGIQSNLWLLDDECCKLLLKHDVRIGTSLDGPEPLNDRQCGGGHHERTMRGIRQARSAGLTVGCIATFTGEEASRAGEAFDFFREEGLDFTVHAASPPLDGPVPSWVLSPARYGPLLCDLLRRYLPHRKEVAVGTLDQMIRAVATGQGQVCTFRDCLGMFLVIDCFGDIYPCQRFAGRREFRLGAVEESPSWDELMNSPMARRMAARQREIQERCAGCEHLPYCRGGCPFNAWAGRNDGRIVDPYCEAYRAVFGRIRDILVEEIENPANQAALAARPYDGQGHPLLRVGACAELVADGPHPKMIASNARRILAAAARGSSRNARDAASRLVDNGTCQTMASAEKLLDEVDKHLHATTPILNRVYIHVTQACPLACTHCYCSSHRQSGCDQHMPVAKLAILVRQAMDAGFRKIVLTGGEPLAHPQVDRLLEAAAAVRDGLGPTAVSFRSSFVLPVDDDLLVRLSDAVSEVVVSLDGDEASHDARRGAGSFARTIRNLERYVSLSRGRARAATLALCSVLSQEDMQGRPGTVVRSLARRLGLGAVRFRQLLPLGRAREGQGKPVPAFPCSQDTPDAVLLATFPPSASCGLGQTLSVSPAGVCHPCHACYDSSWELGNVFDAGLAPILGTGQFLKLSATGVDSNPLCGTCALRYLCGGTCHAWAGAGLEDLACTKRRDYATGVLAAAQTYLGIPVMEEIPS